MEFVDQSLLARSDFGKFAFLLGFRTRQQQAIVADKLFAVADQHVLNAARDATPMMEEVDDGSFGSGNVAGSISATRASSAPWSSAIRLSMKSRSRSDKLIESNLREQ
jgi:hypothetical protein